MGLKCSKKSRGTYQVQEEEDKEIPATSAFEKVLDDVGSEGKFQKLMIWGFMLPLALFNNLGSANTALLLTTPDHTCHVPGRPENMSHEAWKNMTIPWELDKTGSTKWSTCHMYNVSADDVVDYSDEVYEPEQNYTNLNVSTQVIDCLYGWDFDDSVWKETPVSKFGWVCDRKYIVTTLFSLTYAGNAVGTLVFSVISDSGLSVLGDPARDQSPRRHSPLHWCLGTRKPPGHVKADTFGSFGRKLIFYVVATLSVLCSVASIFAPSLTIYSVLKFCLALSYYSLYQMAYIIVIELCGENLRAFTAVSSFIACILGSALVSLFAYLTQHWKVFVLACHLPTILFLFYCRCIPESPQWLLARSRVAECEQILKRVARLNGKSFTNETRKLLLEAQKQQAKKGSLKKILTSLVLAKHLILTCSLLSIGYVLYSGMILNIHNLSGSKILNYFILLAIEIPGNIIGSLSARYFGRRLSAIVFNLLAALCCMTSTMTITNEWMLVALCATTKMSAGAIVLVVYMQIGELFPASLRGTAYGVTGVVGLAAMIFIPPLIAMGGSNVFLPYYILAGIGGLGIILSSFLPETLSRPLPQTVDEAVHIGDNQHFFSLIHKWNAHKYLEAPQEMETYVSQSFSEQGGNVCYPHESYIYSKVRYQDDWYF